MTRVTRSTVKRVHFTPKPTPKSNAPPKPQIKFPSTPRKRKASRGVLPAENSEITLASLAPVREMSPAGQAQFNKCMPLKGSPVNFEEVLPNDSPSPTFTVINNRRRRSGASLPNRRWSTGRKGYAVNGAATGPPSPSSSTIPPKPNPSSLPLPPP